MWNLGLPIQLPLPFFPPSNLFAAHDIPCAAKYWLLDSHPRTLKHTRCFMHPRIFGFENLPLYVSVCVYICLFSSVDVSK